LTFHLVEFDDAGAVQRLRASADSDIWINAGYFVFRNRVFDYMKDGEELVIESSMKTPDRTFHFKDHWSLSDAGRTLTMAHPDDDLAGQVSVLEKAPPGAATNFTRPA